MEREMRGGREEGREGERKGRGRGGGGRGKGEEGGGEAREREGGGGGGEGEREGRGGRRQDGVNLSNEGTCFRTTKYAHPHTLHQMRRSTPPVSPRQR